MRKICIRSAWIADACIFHFGELWICKWEVSEGSCCSHSVVHPRCVHVNDLINMNTVTPWGSRGELLINELGDDTQTVCAELALSLNIVTFPCQNWHYLLCFSFPFLSSPPCNSHNAFRSEHRCALVWSQLKGHSKTSTSLLENTLWLDSTLIAVQS